MASYLSWIEISPSALKNNITVIKKQLSPQTKIMAMVKANAYGHGLDLVSKALSPQVDFFGVNTFKEAVAIRKLGLKNPILIAAPIHPSHFSLAYKHNFSLCVPSLDYLNQLSQIGLPIPLHLKINTGMNRLGLSLLELLSAIDILKHTSLNFEGIYTHFHSSDTNKPTTLLQLDTFNQAVYQTKYNFPGVLAHAANSAAIFNYRQSHLDMVRPGLAIYGLYDHPKLTPTLSWFCHPVQTRKLSIDDAVGYCATYTSKSNEFMATLPIGYSDGLDRKLSNKGRVFFQNSYFPIIGRIAMNFSTISTANIKLEPNSKIELIGPHISATEIANITDTINYEVVSRLSPAVPRILV